MRPATASEDQPGPTGIFQSSLGGCSFQLVEIPGARERPARSEPRNSGHSGCAREFVSELLSICAVGFGVAGVCAASIASSAVCFQREWNENLYSPVMPSLRKSIDTANPAKA